MPDQITNYQCPACGGPLHYVGASDRLECDYCGSSYTVAEIEKFYAEKDEAAALAAEQFEGHESSDPWDSSGVSDDWHGEDAGLKAYNCPSCGAELICEETTAATCCPYCGNPTVVPASVSGALKPDFVIPFKLTKEDAVRNLKEHYKGKKLLPKAFRDENHVQDIQGVYVPFWLFDGEADADVTFQASNSSTHVSGNYRVTTTRHYDVRRAGTVRFEKIPVDASTKMPNEYMDAIEPYDYGELRGFSTGYLPGFFADKYDQSPDECSDRADSRAKASAVNAMQESVSGYDSVTETGAQVYLRRGKAHYAMLPVWLLNTTWKGKGYLFAMNGQTGRMVSDLPMDKGLWWAWFAGITGVLTAIISGIGILLSL